MHPGCVSAHVPNFRSYKKGLENKTRILCTLECVNYLIELFYASKECKKQTERSAMESCSTSREGKKFKNSRVVRDVECLKYY